MAVTIPLLGRRGTPAAQPAGRRAGNAAATVARRAYGSVPTMRAVTTTASQVGLAARTPAYANGLKIARDRHILERTGTTKTSRLRNMLNPGFPNPEADGPARPAAEMLNRTISWQVGTDHASFLDNDAPHASTIAGARRFPLGTQDGTVRPRFGGTPGLYRPYGARGVVFGPPPRIVAEAGGPYLAGKVLDPGSVQDGPQLVDGGAPHGLHSATVPPSKVTRGRYRATKQMRPGRQDRPANSRIAGQSYSQTVVPQSGVGGGPLPRINGGRQPGLNSRWR